MKNLWLLCFLIAACAMNFSTSAQAAGGRCRVMDPTGTPLKFRTAPYGAILGTLSNGMLVSIIDQSNDGRGHPWVYVADYGTRQPIGWVYREYIACF